MKKVLASLSIVLGLSLISMTSFAQQRPAKRGGMQMQKELNLTTDQEQKIEALNKDFRTKMKELRDDSKLSKEDKQTKMKSLGEEHRSSINGVLTTEQQTKMKELREKAPKMRANREFRGKDQRGKQRGHHNMAQMRHRDPFSGLDLTDDQKQKMKALNENYRAKNKELAEQRRAEMNKILTPEQQAKMKERQEKFQKKDRKPEMRRQKAEKDKA